VTVLRRAATAGAALAAVAAGAVLPATPAPAAVVAPAPAAPCAALDPADLDPALVREYAAEVDFVFVGRVLSRQRLPDAGEAGGEETEQPRRGTRRYGHSVTVKAALKGDVRNVVAVVTDTRRSTGIGPLRQRSDYIFFVDEIETGRSGALNEDRQFEAVECSGTTRLTAPMGTRLERQLQQLLAEDAEESGMPVELTEPDGGATEPPSLTRSIAPGVALTLVGLLGLLLFSRVGRRA